MARRQITGRRRHIRNLSRNTGRDMGRDLPGFFEATEMPNTGWWEALWPDPAAVLAAVGVRSGMDVIDLCSGDGWFTLPIAKVGRHVTAIDIDSDLLQAGRHRLDQNG